MAEGPEQAQDEAETDSDSILTISKEHIMQIRDVSSTHTSAAKILRSQRALLVELFDLRNPRGAMKISGMPNGFANADSTSVTYITSPEICFAHSQCNPGDIITYRVSFDGLEGMVIGLTEDLQNIAILNLNFQKKKYVLEHYPIQHVFGGYPNPQDVRERSAPLSTWIDETADAESETNINPRGTIEGDTLVITRVELMDIRNCLHAMHAPNAPIVMRQRRDLAELFQLRDISYKKIRIVGVRNGFGGDGAEDGMTYDCDCGHLGVRVGDILTYRVSFDGLEGMVLGCTGDRIAILNINFVDTRYLIEHYDRGYIFGGYPNAQDVRELSADLDSWIKELDHYEEEVSEDDSFAEDTITVTRQDIFKIRNMVDTHGDVPITPEQRKELWKLFRLHDYDHSYLKLENIVDGFYAINGETESFYTTTPKVCKAFGNHGLEAGDILTYSVSYNGLEGMILGVSRDRQSMAILNLNYSQDQYILEHYSAAHILGGYPRVTDKRDITSKFFDRGLRNPEVKQYYEKTLLPYCLDAPMFFNTFGLPNPVITTIATFVAEMTSVEDFALLSAESVEDKAKKENGDIV